MASEIASILRGKRKPQYTPNVDTGDFVVIINASKVKLTGNKLATKKKYTHSGFPGGLKEMSISDMLVRRPERVIEGAVKGMLPKNTLGRAMRSKLKVYGGPDHPHQAQNPRQITLEV
ncbi:MAG: 50S ribosomal protein L13 [Coriobacteriia bacterium]|nr:50S ribosomal protein L13 [Coriobacteriia bacterium]